MKTILKTIFACSVVLALAGCAKESDVTALQDDVKTLKSQIEQLQSDIRSLNGQAAGLTETIENWKKGGFVENIQELSDKSGYTISFVGGKTVTLYHGAKGEKGDPGTPGKDGDPGTPGKDGDPGKDGKTPSIKMDTDGTFYWTVDDQFILVNGQKVPATVTPVFSINDNGDLIMTIAGQETNLGHVKGTDGVSGDSLFEKIEPGEEVVVFTLVSGDSFSIPLAKAFKLVIENPEQEVSAGQKVEIAYSVKNGNESTVVDCFAGGNFIAKVDNGKVIVTVPDPVSDGQVLVWAQNDQGLFSMVKLTFTIKAEVVIVTPETDYQTLPGEAGNFDINLTSNVDVDVNLPAEATWLKAVLTKSAYVLKLTFEENATGEPREAEIDVVRKDNGVSVQKIKVIQLALTGGDTPKVLKIEKLWEKLSSADANWFASIGGTDGADFNIAIDDKNVYIPEFGGSKNLWAIDIATGNTISKVNTSTVESVGFDGSIFLSCARVVKKNDGTPVLMASNLFQDGDSANPTGRLYIWENGVDNPPAVKVLQQWGAGRRLGDTWTTYGNYEDCWMIMGTQTGNGFVTFRVPTGATSYLMSRLAVETTNFCSYYPFPGELTKGMFAWRGGDHDDGLAYRNRQMTIASTEEAIKIEGAHTATLTKMTQWMSNYENNNGSGFNYFEFNGKRYVAWVINMADGKVFDLVVKEGEASAAWDSIINTPAANITAAGGFAFRESLAGGQATTWKQGTDCAVWNNGEEVYIAVNKVNVGIAVYKMYMADAE